MTSPLPPSAPLAVSVTVVLRAATWMLQRAMLFVKDSWVSVSSSTRRIRSAMSACRPMLRQLRPMQRQLQRAPRTAEPQPLLSLRLRPLRLRTRRVAARLQLRPQLPQLVLQSTVAQMLKLPWPLLLLLQQLSMLARILGLQLMLAVVRPQPSPPTDLVTATAQVMELVTVALPTALVAATKAVMAPTTEMARKRKKRRLWRTRC